MMDAKEKEQLMELAKLNQGYCEVVQKNIGWLARRLKKTNPETDMDKFQTNLIEASLFLNSYSMATKIFNKMVVEKNENPELDKHMWLYFKEEVEENIKLMETEDDN